MDKATIEATAKLLGYTVVPKKIATYGGTLDHYTYVVRPNGVPMFDSLNESPIDLSHWAVVADMKAKYGIEA